MGAALSKWLFGLQIDVVNVQTEKKLHKYMPYGLYAGATIDSERRANEFESVR